jgi:prepilin signal peptidase PulO-like enzyme (type II secretory pathway)
VGNWPSSPATFAILFGWALAGWLLGLGLDPLASRIARPAGLADPGQVWLRGGGPRVGLTVLGPILALLFGLTAARYPEWPPRLLVSFYLAVLLLVAVLDLHRRLVYGVVTYPVTLLALLLTPLVLDQPLGSGLVGAAVGGLIFGGLHLLARRVYHTADAFGLGDVMIAGLVGAMTGWPGVARALFLGALLGGLVALGLLLTRHGRRAHFAYGPALCLGALLTLLGGPAE